MNHINTVVCEGNVVSDAEFSVPAPNFKKCVIPMAINRRYKDADGNTQEEVSYVDVEVYGDYGEQTATSAVKGRGFRVVGRIKQDRWTDADGKEHSKIFIVGEHIEWKPKPVKQDEAKDEPADNSGYLL